jgi:hypothetical protein
MRSGPDPIVSEAESMGFETESMEAWTECMDSEAASTLSATEYIVWPAD